MIVGITGSIGSGKSTVTKYLSDKGYNTFSCDEYNKELLGELCVYDDIAKQPNRKNCALIPLQGIMKILDYLDRR